MFLPLPLDFYYRRICNEEYSWYSSRHFLGPDCHQHKVVETPTNFFLVHQYWLAVPVVNFRLSAAYFALDRKRGRCVEGGMYILNDIVDLPMGKPEFFLLIAFVQTYMKSRRAGINGICVTGEPPVTSPQQGWVSRGAKHGLDSVKTWKYLNLPDQKRQFWPAYIQLSELEDFGP